MFNFTPMKEQILICHVGRWGELTKRRPKALSNKSLKTKEARLGRHGDDLRCQIACSCDSIIVSAKRRKM
ncbi:hypothetical protein LZ32DRAFT_76304 [Colletotrichum eremochloae]|nr:hypothetical protein LZ32DRAFT_76304 [Colletotrichum eremochloae]